jgi:hypothetical protein
MHNLMRCPAHCSMLLLSLLLTIVAVLPASAQVVRGRVVLADDATPIGEVAVTIFQAGTPIFAVESDSLGIFEIELPAAAEYTLIATRQGFASIGPATFDAPAGRTLDMVLQMTRDVVVLNPLNVRVRANPRNSLDAALQRSTDNRHFGVGFHMNRKEIDAAKRSSLPELIASMTPNVQLVQQRPPMKPSGEGRGFNYSPVPGTLPEEYLAITRSGSLCALALFVDGIRVTGSTFDGLPAPGNVDTVEVYPGPHQTGGYLDPNGCGIALVWTRRDTPTPAYRRTVLGSAVLAGMAALAAVVLVN